VLTTDTCDASRRVGPLEETINGIQVHRIKNLSNYLAWHQQLFLPMGTGAFLRERVREFDVIHLHMYRTYQNIAVRRIGDRRGVPYVLSAHGTVPRIVRRKIMKALFDSTYGKRLLRDAARLVALSNAEKLQYESAGVPPEKISIVFNGIDPATYQELPPRGAFARTHALDGKKLVTYIGRLNARKGLDHLLRAFRDLTMAREDIALVLVGPDDGYRRRLERLAAQLALSDRVVFTGLITIPYKLQVIVDSDLIVYPATHEIFGLVPFEALLCGRPVVVADDSGCGEIIKSAQAGLTVPYGDVARLRDAIAMGLGDDPQISDMVLRGRKFVLEELSWSRVAENMERVYEDAITANHRVIAES